jgi:serine/threonine protein kinase
MEVGSLDRIRDEVRQRLFRSSTQETRARVPDLGERYEVLHPLGRGAASVVWEVEHTGTGRRLAAKVLSVDDAFDGTIAKRLLLEARATGVIRHPNVIEVIDTGVAADGKPFLVMELLVGRTLEQLLRDEGAMSWERAAPILRQIASGLAAAHRIGVVHRDLKPANVMLVDDGSGETRCKVLDFGLARWQQLDEITSRLTRTGAVFGTPSYMSPEQINRGEVDARSDVYSLGCLAYELVGGKRPFEGESIGEVLYQQLFEHPRAPLPVDAPINRAAVAWIRRCMRKRPSLRFEDMHAAIAALDDILLGRGPVAVPEEPLIPGSSSSLVIRVAPPQRDHWIVGTLLVAVASLAVAVSASRSIPVSAIDPSLSAFDDVAWSMARDVVTSATSRPREESPAASTTITEPPRPPSTATTTAPVPAAPPDEPTKRVRRATTRAPEPSPPAPVVAPPPTTTSDWTDPFQRARRRGKTP